MRRSVALLALTGLVALALVVTGCGGPEVPNVVGMKQADAVRTLQEAGYMLGDVSAVATRTVELGRIAGQTPAGGDRAREGTVVNLMVSFSDGTNVVVPNVTGMSSTTAQGVAETLNLTGVLVEQYSADAAKGTTFAQVPEAGGQVAAGDTLVIIVSKGPEPEKADVPDVKGKSESDAVSKVEDAGFESAVSKVYNSDVAKGKVIAQVPEAGSNERTGSTIQIVVSLGKGTGSAKVPSVKGKKEADAVKAIESAGLKAKKVYSASANVAKGAVIEQFPASGATAAKGSEVLIQVSSGPQASSEAAVPNVMGMSQADAESAIRSTGFTVTAEQKGAAAEGDVVVYQFPKAGDAAAAGADVLIVVGAQ